MRRTVTFLLAGVVLAGGLLVPMIAAAAAPSAISQPTAAVRGKPYSFQFADPAHGAVTSAYWTIGEVCDNHKTTLYDWMPTGLSMSDSGLISGTPTQLVKADLCINLTFADDASESAPFDLTVGTGNATLDTLLLPAATELAIAQRNDGGLLEDLLSSVEGLLGCLPVPNRYCGI